MSNAETPSAANPNSKTTESPAAAAKPPGKDRWLVRIVMLALLIVVAIEGASYGRVLVAHWQLKSEINKSEQEHYLVTKARVDALLKRSPDEKHLVKAAVGEEQYDVYYYWGLLKQRELCVHYGVPGLKGDAEVVDVYTIIPDEVLAKK